jgi:heat shock protein HslJ
MSDGSFVPALIVAVTLTAGCAATGGGDAPLMADVSPQTSVGREIDDAATARAAGYTARGNEPAWSLIITPDLLALTADGGPTVLQARSPEPEATADGRRYVTRTDTGELRIEVASRVCRDTMSGMSYPETVTILVNGKTLAGCGGTAGALLQGGEWVVEEIAGVPVVPDSRVTLNFLPDGRVAGSGGCNRYTATYTVTGEGMTIGAAATTRMACAQALMDQEQRFLEMLRTVVRHEFADPDILILVGAKDARIIARKSRPGTPPAGGSSPASPR